MQLPPKGPTSTSKPPTSTADLTGRVARRGRRRLRGGFMRPFETPQSKKYWQEQLKLLIARRRFKIQDDRQTEVTRRFKFSSLKDLNRNQEEEPEDFRRQVQEKKQLRLPKKSVFDLDVLPKTQERPNQLRESFQDDAQRRLATQTLNKLPPALRSIVTMSLDPDDKLPLSAFSETTREKIQKAREGDPTGLVELSLNKKDMDEMAVAGKRLLVQRDKEEALERRRRVGPTVPRVQRLEREETVLDETQKTREFQKATSPEGVFADTLEDGKEAPPTRDISEYESYIDKVMDQFYAGDEENVDVSLSEDGIVFNYKGVRRLVFYPPTIAEDLHGKEVAENYALQGSKALPEDSPLNKPGLGKGTLKILSMTAEILDGPRVEIKHKVIEPILPDFALDMPLRGVAQYVPQIQLADLGLKALGLPTILETLPEDFTLTDEIVAEVTSFILDPLNLLPGIGFANDIIRIGKVLKVGGTAAVRAGLLKLGKNPKFLQFADDALQLAKAEAGFLKITGQTGDEAVLQARRAVLDDIANGVETTDEALIPVRREMDNLIEKESGFFKVPETRATETFGGVDSINVPEGFELRGTPMALEDVESPIRLHIGFVDNVEVSINNMPAGDGLPAHISVDIMRSGDRTAASLGTFGKLLKAVYSVVKANPGKRVISDVKNPRLARVLDSLGFKTLDEPIQPAAKVRHDAVDRHIEFDEDTLLRVLEKRGYGKPRVAAKVTDEALGQRWVDDAVAEFGEAGSIDDAAFILEDGRLLKFDPDEGHAAIDRIMHPERLELTDAELTKALDEGLEPLGSVVDSTREFGEVTGAIRFVKGVDGTIAEIVRPISDRQRQLLLRAAEGSKQVIIDVTDVAGKKVIKSSDDLVGVQQVRRYLDDLVRNPPEEWVAKIDEVPSVPKTADKPLNIDEMAELAKLTTEPGPALSKGQLARRRELERRFRTVSGPGPEDAVARRLLQETDDKLAAIGRGEEGGARLRPLEAGDNVHIREGQFEGQRGRVKSTIRKGKQLDVELDIGRVIRVKQRQVDVLDVLEEAAEFGEVPLAVRTRLERMSELRRQIPKVGKKARAAMEKELAEFEEQARLAEGFQEAIRPGGKLATNAEQVEQLEKFRKQLASAKGEGRKAPLRRKIAALEEAMGLSQPNVLDVVDDVKRAYVSSQEETLDHLIRRQDEITHQLTKRRGTMNADELAELEHRGKEIREELIRIRGEADETVEHIIKARQQIEEGALTPTTLSLEDFEKFAFSKKLSPVGRVVHWAGHVPGLRKFVNLTDPSLFHRDNFIGRTLVAYERLSEAMSASTETAFRALTAKGVPFKRTKGGLEELTGRPLFDLIEDWDNVKHMFGAEQDEFVQLLAQTRLEALRDMKKLGVDVPDAWLEATHVFRKALSKQGIDFKALSRHAETAKPGSLRRRAYEVMADGHAGGVKYDQDIIGVHVSAVHALREHAAKKAFLNRIKWERGVPMKLFVSQEHRLTASLAAREYSWAKVARKYIHDSVRGRPPKPGLRASKLFEVEPPADVTDLVNRVAELNRGKRDAGVLDEIRSIRSQIDNITKRDSARLKKAKSDYKIARESIVNTVQAEGARFGKPGEAVATSPAPFGTFPELGGRLYLADDMDYLMKVAGDTKNPFVGIAKGTSKVTGVMKVFQTALDPGFWFIQGLGAIGLDMANLARGKPTAIWGKSAYRSLVGLVKGRKAAEFWANEAARHPDDWAEFLQHARVLSNHTEYADELVAEAVAGGLIETVERSIPIVNKVHPFARAGNAFSNFMDAAAWETWKALRPLAKTTDEVEELGAFVRNVSGRNSTRGLGMSHGQELIERSALYARSYTRAGAAIMAKATFDPLSFGGRQAFKSLAGLGAASTAIIAGATVLQQLLANGGDFSKLDWDDLGSTLKEAWTPWSSKFMGMRIGDQVIGMGGTVRSNIAMMARLGKMGYDVAAGDVDPNKLSPVNLNSRFLINFDHPIVRFLRGKSSPLVGTAWDLFSGEDFLGYTVDDPKDLLRMPLQLAPFASQVFIEQTGLGLGERTGVTTAEWFGVRNFPINAWQLYKEQAEEALGDVWDNIASTDRLKQAEQDKDNYPELVEAKKKLDEDQRARGDDFQKIEDLLDEGKVEKKDKLLPLALEIDWSRPGGGELFAEQYKYISAQYRNDFDLAAKALGVELKENPEYKGLDAQLEAELIELEPLDFRDADNNIDWDAYNEAADAIKSQMSQENRKAAEEKKFNLGDPQLEEVVRRRATAIEQLDPYINAPKYKDLTVEEGQEVDKLLGLASEVRDLLAMAGTNVSRSEIIQFMLEAKFGDVRIVSTAWVASKSSLSHMVRSTVQRDLVFRHPDLVVFYPFTFYDLSDEEQEEWEAKFGRGGNAGVGSLPSLELEPINSR